MLDIFRKSKFTYYCDESLYRYVGELGGEMVYKDKCKYSTKNYEEYRQHLAEIHHTDDCEDDWY